MALVEIAQIGVHTGDDTLGQLEALLCLQRIQFLHLCVKDRQHISSHIHSSRTATGGWLADVSSIHGNHCSTLVSRNELQSTYQIISGQLEFLPQDSQLGLPKQLQSPQVDEVWSIHPYSLKWTDNCTLLTFVAEALVQWKVSSRGTSPDAAENQRFTSRTPSTQMIRASNRTLGTSLTSSYSSVHACIACSQGVRLRSVWLDAGQQRVWESTTWKTWHKYISKCFCPPTFVR